MAKFEITMTYTYEVDLETLVDSYATTDLDEALGIDLDNFKHEPFAYIDQDDVVVTGRIVDRDV